MALEEKGDDGDRPDRIEGPLCIPSCDPSVEDGVGKGEKHLGVGILGVVVASRDVLRKQIPMPRRKFGMRTVGPIFSDHLLLIG